MGASKKWRALHTKTFWELLLDSQAEHTVLSLVNKEPGLLSCLIKDKPKMFGCDIMEPAIFTRIRDKQVLVRM